MGLVLDTGPLLADLDADDRYHGPCSDLIRSTRERRIVPAVVLPEVDRLSRQRLSADGFIALLTDIRHGAYDIEELAEADYDRVDEVLRTYRDLGVGFVDAAVLAIVERLGETKLATLDRRHFAAMRPRHVAALDLLPVI